MRQIAKWISAAYVAVTISRVIKFVARFSATGAFDPFTVAFGIMVAASVPISSLIQGALPAVDAVKNPEQRRLRASAHRTVKAIRWTAIIADAIFNTGEQVLYTLENADAVTTLDVGPALQTGLIVFALITGMAPTIFAMLFASLGAATERIMTDRQDPWFVRVIRGWTGSLERKLTPAKPVKVKSIVGTCKYGCGFTNTYASTGGRDQGLRRHYGSCEKNPSGNGYKIEEVKDRQLPGDTR